MTGSAREPRPSTGLSSVANAARVLKEFGRGDTQLGVSQLARRLGISKSTAHRVVATLVLESLLEKVEDTGLFRLTETMRGIGASAETAQLLHQASTSALDSLRAVTDHTLHVAILDGTDVLYVERRESPGALAVFRRVGARNSVHVTSTGKVLLAFLPQEQRDEVVGSLRLTARTPHSITSRTEFLRELSRVRRNGYAQNLHESEPGMCSIAAPIRDRNTRVVAALSIAAKVPDRSLGLISLARPLVSTAGQISHALGWRGHPRA